MDFLQATDLLMKCRNLRDVARTASVSYQAVRQARLAPGHSNKRPPPAGWERAVAALARERATELEELAERLDAE